MGNPYNKLERDRERGLNKDREPSAREDDAFEQEDDTDLTELPAIEDNYLEPVDGDEEDDSRSRRPVDGRRLAEENDDEDDDEFTMPDPRPSRRRYDEDEDDDSIEDIFGDEPRRQAPQRVIYDNAITYEAMHETWAPTDEPLRILGRRTNKRLARMIFDRSDGLTGTWRISQQALMKKGERGKQRWYTQDVFDLDVGPDGSMDTPVYRRPEYESRPAPPPEYDYDRDDEGMAGVNAFVNSQADMLRQIEGLRRDFRESRDARARSGGILSNADNIKEWLTILTPLFGGLGAVFKQVTSSGWDGIEKGIQLAQKSNTPGMLEIISAAAIPLLARGGMALGDSLQQPTAGSQPSGPLLTSGPPQPSLPSPPPYQAPQTPTPPQQPQPAQPAQKEPSQVTLIRKIGEAFKGTNQRLTAELYWANMAWTHFSEGELNQFIAAGPQVAQETLRKVHPDLPPPIVEKSGEWFANMFGLIRNLEEAMQQPEAGADQPPGGNSPPED